MLLIRNHQIKQLSQSLHSRYLTDCITVLSNEHPELYLKKTQNEWNVFFDNNMVIAKKYGITDSKLVYVFILLMAQHEQLFVPKFPEWAVENLTWPGRSERSKLVNLHKEINGLNK